MQQLVDRGQLQDSVLNHQSRLAVKRAGHAASHIFCDVELELESQELVEGLLVRRVVSQQRHEKLVLVQLTLEALQDDVQDAVGVQVEVANDGTNDLQDFSRRPRPAPQILRVQLRDQLGVTLRLLPKQIELLLFVEKFRLHFDDGCEELFGVLDDSGFTQGVDFQPFFEAGFRQILLRLLDDPHHPLSLVLDVQLQRLGVHQRQHVQHQRPHLRMGQESRLSQSLSNLVAFEQAL